MRADMQDVLTEVYRVNRAYATAASKAAKRSERQKDPEDLPSHSSMRPKNVGWETKSFGDRLAPLERFLTSRVGKPWDKVYSEICEHTDMRDVMGRHLMSHVRQFVETDLKPTYTRSWGFYVDPKGILRKAARPKWKRPDPDWRVISLTPTMLIYRTLVGIYEIPLRDPQGEADRRWFSDPKTVRWHGEAPWPDTFGPRPKLLERKFMVSKRLLSTDEVAKRFHIV